MGERIVTWRALGAAAISVLLLIALGPRTGPAVTADGNGRRAAVYRSAVTEMSAVALTFDDGPDPFYTPQILDVLDQFGARATFFVLGSEAERYPHLLRLIAGRGHEVGTHSYAHRNLTRLSGQSVISELARADQVISQAVGTRPRDLRPPYGFVNDTVLDVAGQFGYRIILWTDEHDTRDWSRPNSSVIVSRALSRAEKGMIVLLHDSGGNRDQTLKALPAILAQLRERGYQCVTVDELLTGHLATGGQAMGVPP